MKLKILFLIGLLLLTTCKKNDKDRLDSQSILKTSILQFTETDKDYTITYKNQKKSFSKSELPIKSAVILNASLIGYFTELKAENKIVGVSSPEYIYSPKILGLISSGNIQNVGNEQKYNVEKIISLKPDAVFANYIASFENTYQLLEKNGIKVVFLDEFYEQQPLEKTSYLKIFGKLLGKEKEADNLYSQIETEYLKIKKIAANTTTRPEVIANEMYGNLWYLPGGKTITANFIKDANADYILKNNDKSNAVTMTFEEVYAISKSAKFWINAGNHSSKTSLLSINPFYDKLDVFRSGKIFSVTAKEKNKGNDYFESGVVRSDLVLKDYVKIFHPELLTNYQLYYLKEIQ